MTRGKSYDAVRNKNPDVLKRFEVMLLLVFSSTNKLNDAPFEFLKSSEIIFHKDLHKFSSLDLVK